jgi:hypothetical protein
MVGWLHMAVELHVRKICGIYPSISVSTAQCDLQTPLILKKQDFSLRRENEDEKQDMLTEQKGSRRKVGKN